MKRLLTLFMVALLGGMMQLSAQEQTATTAELNALNQRLADLEAQIEKREQRSEKWEKVVSKLPKISGFTKISYTWNDAGTSNFKVNYVRVNLAGDLGKGFDYKLQVEFSSPKLIDAYIRWSPVRAFGVQLGQFHVPFSLEGPLSPTKLETIEDAYVSKTITGMPDTRDLGFQFYGQFAKAKDDHYLFDYGIGVFQGEGKNNADKNKSKDVIGRLKFFPIKDLCLTGSYSYGERGEEYVINQRASAGVEYKPQNLVVRSEYFWHKQGTENAIYNEGFYVVAMYQIGKFAPVVRYNFYNEKTLREDRADCVVGVNYFPIKNLKFQLNYTHTHFSATDKSSISTVGFAAIAMF